MNPPPKALGADIALRPATPDDLPLLAEMNRQLIQDEGSRNPMDLAALVERMCAWLGGEYRVILFTRGNAVVGYAVYQMRPDEHLPQERYVYLRQFFVRREARRQGIGRSAFRLLRHECLPAGAPIVLDVLTSNPGGRRFWDALGFRPYCTAMRLARDSSRPPGVLPATERISEGG
jgi:GNAT superfamily N-acetyltransferase